MGNNALPTVALYIGSVMHMRMKQYAYRFKYKIFCLLLDIDRLADAERSSKIFSIDKFNVFSIWKKDLGHAEMSWRKWISKTLASAALDSEPKVIRLLTMPRVLGYQFNPLSMWYCYDKNEQLYAIVAEVHNTYGERHPYVLKKKDFSQSSKIEATAKKTFYVSPFIDMSTEYHFSCIEPSDSVKIYIREFVDEKPFFIANQIARQYVFSTASLLRVFFAIPFVTFKIIFAIHWQALKLFARGAPIFKRHSDSLGG